MAVDYAGVSPGLYEYSVNSPNPLTRYYHSNRYGKIREFLSGEYSDGMKILDLGCGTSSWNTSKVPLTGLDVSRKMLAHGKRLGFITDCICCDLTKIPLPFENGSFDFVVLSEVIEHLPNPEKTLKEVNRILKEGGYLIATVPLDVPASMWNILFGLKCFLVGTLLGDEYWKRGCGHVQHFSPASFRTLLEDQGFSIFGEKITIMNIGVMARKKT